MDGGLCCFILCGVGIFNRVPIFFFRELPQKIINRIFRL